MLTVLALLLVTLGPLQVHGHTGVVVDASGRPIAGAAVIVAGAGESARTGIDGAFILRSLPAPPFVVIVILPDGRVARPIRLEHSDQLREIRLDSDAQWSDTLTVHGIAPGIAVSRGAANSSETSAGLALRQPVTLTQAIENVPGVSWISEGQSATPSIRGLARGRTLILLDGARVSTERGAGANASFLDPAWLARVDVSRGPGSVAYGTDAFGGVIAARTLLPDIASPFSVRASATAGDGLPVRRGDLDITYGYGRGGIVAGGRMREFGNYQSPEGEVPHSGWEDSGARVQWVHAIGGGRLHAGWQGDAARDIGRPRSDSNTIVATSPFERSQRAAVAFERASWRAWRDLRIDTFAGTSSERLEQDRLPAPGRPRRVDRTDSSARDLQIRATGARTFGATRLHTGIDVLRRSAVRSTDTAFQYNIAGALASTTITESLEDARRTAVGLFVDADAVIRPWLRLAGGLRGETIHSTNRGGFFGDREIDHQPVAASGAVTLISPHGLSVTAQTARGFREPTLTDRFSRGPVGRGFIEGNPDLEPETSRQFDLAIRYTRGRVDLHGALYRYEIRNLVERYLAAPDSFRIRNRGRVRLSGAELAAQVGVGGGVTLDVVAQTSQGEDRDDGTPLNDVAPGSLALIARHSWRTRLSSYVKVAAIAAHDAAGPAEVPTPAYTLVDLAASWRVTSGVEVRAIVRNALDDSYYSSAGPRWVFAPGRQALVTLVLAAGLAPSK